MTRSCILLVFAFSLSGAAEAAPGKAKAKAAKKRNVPAEVAKPQQPPAAEKRAVQPNAQSPSLGQVAEQQRTPERDRLDAAIRDIKEERYGPAAVTLHDLAATENLAPALREEAEYHLAKALYRLGLHHSSIEHFARILERGPAGSLYAEALEWSLFIARKIAADSRVLEMVAKFADGTFPAEYESEFNYLLARHHYVRAMAMETTGAGAVAGDARVEETTTGGRSLQGDVFDDEAPEEREVVRRDGRGFSLDEDVFADEDEPVAKPAAAPAAARADDGELTPKERIEAAKRLVDRVKENSAFAARAKFLEAVLQYHEGKGNDALEGFKSVVRLAKDGGAQADPELRQLALFQLARTHFGANQPSFSLFYYDKMERFTEEWLEALYESSWAQFRLGNYEKALGNLLTLHSPFFVDEYFPESHILKAVVYYENCRYAEAKRILTDFLGRYEPVLGGLGELIDKQQQPDKYYEVLANLQSGAGIVPHDERARVMGQILSIATSDPELGDLDASHAEVMAELASLDKTDEVFARSALKTQLAEQLVRIRDELQLDVGRALKRKLESERARIKELVTQAVRIDVETAAAEQRRMESTLRGVDVETKRRENEFVEWADDEKLVWPFEEEYWRDELGTYELTLADTCRARGGAPLATVE